MNIEIGCVRMYLTMYIEIECVNDFASSKKVC